MKARGHNSLELLFSNGWQVYPFGYVWAMSEVVRWDSADRVEPRILCISEGTGQSMYPSLPLSHPVQTKSGIKVEKPCTGSILIFFF